MHRHSFLLALKKSNSYKNNNSKAFTGCLYVQSQRIKESDLCTSVFLKAIVKYNAMCTCS